jgi:diadenosine tetraphosphate (Ap4A) HIT family hydrolase
MGGIKMNTNWKLDRIGAAHRGENPMVIARMKSGFAVIGDTQFLPGYCVLLPYEVVSTLNDLPYKQRNEYLLDMSIIGDAIQTVCKPRRINYSIYGNTDAFLHAHIFPRYEWEPEERKPYPVWQYPPDRWSENQYQYRDESHLELKEQLSKQIQLFMSRAYQE